MQGHEDTSTNVDSSNRYLIIEISKRSEYRLTSSSPGLNKSILSISFLFFHLWLIPRLLKQTLGVTSFTSKLFYLMHCLLKEKNDWVWKKNNK